MTTSIDATKPAAGNALTANVRANFGYAKDDINSLLRMSEDRVLVTGTADALVATYAVAPTLGEGLRILLTAASTNATTTPTLDVNSTGATTIVQEDGTAVEAGDIVAGGYYDLVYDATNTVWVLLNRTTSSQSLAAYATISYVDAAVAPTGSSIMWHTATAPTGYLEMNGAAVSRTTYADLFAVISTLYGTGDGSTTFNLPDFRGYFARGWDNGAGNDPDAASRTNRGDGTTGDAIGTKQADELASHTHVTPQGIVAGSGVDFASGAFGASTTSQATGGNETRPLNINVMWCIKT